METHLVLLLLTALAAIAASTPNKASSSDTYYTVQKKARRQDTIVTLIGKGINDVYLFKATEDSTVYNNNEEVVIGTKVYSDELNTVYIVGDQNCVQREFAAGSHQDTQLSKDDCDNIKTKMNEARADLFPNNNWDEYKQTTYTTQKKMSSADPPTTTVKITGRGIWDQISFGEEEDVTVINKGNVIVVGKKIISDTKNYLVIVDNNLCTQRQYVKGTIVAAVVLSDADCQTVINKIKRGG